MEKIVRLAPKTLAADATISLSTVANDISLKILSINNGFFDKLKGSKHRNILNIFRYIEIDYIDNQLVMYVKDQSTSNSLIVSGSIVTFSKSKKYKTKLDRITSEINGKLQPILSMKPSLLILNLDRVKANVLYFDILGYVYAMIPNPNDPLSGVFRDLEANNNIVKQIVTNGTLECS